MIAEMLDGFGATAKNVAMALLPLAIIVAFFQWRFLHMPRRRVLRTVVGFLFTFAGLVLFFQGVSVGFMPAGEELGMKLGALDYNWVLIPIGLVLGAAIILAEPAVRVLIYQVEDVTSGYVNHKIVLVFLCVGVAVAVAMSMLKVLYGIPLWYFLLPGYIIAFILTRFANAEFTAIAFDSGSVATGPMTVTFLMAIVVGVAKFLDGRNPIIDGFGMIAITALMPILSLLILGVIYRIKESKHAKQQQ